MSAAAAPVPAFRLRPALWFGGLLSVMLVVEYFIVRRPDFGQRPLLAQGVAFDVVLGLPLLFYLLVVRPSRLPLSALAGAVGAALALARWLLPADKLAAGPALLAGAGYLAAALEGLALVVLAGRTRNVLRAYQAARLQGPDFLENLATALRAGLGRLAGPLLLEAAVLRYALLGAWAAPEVGPADTAFSSHRTSGFPALLAAVGLVLGLESAGAHLLLRHWHHDTLALVWLAADVYAGLFLLAHGQAVRLRPVLVGADSLMLRVGFGWRVRVPRAAVLRLENLTDAPAPRPGLLNLARPLLTPPNLLLTLAAPVEVVGFYGQRRLVSALAFYLDQPAAFRQMLTVPPAG